MHSKILAFPAAVQKHIPSTLGRGLNGSGLRSVRKSVSRNLAEKRREGGFTNTMVKYENVEGKKEKEKFRKITSNFSAPR